MKLNRSWTLRALACLGLLALWWGIGPAWTLWRTHAMQFEQMARQRVTMQSERLEAQTLQKKTVLPPVDALSNIKAISSRLLGATPQPLAGNTVQIQIKAISADRLAQAWVEIRKLTSAMVVKADLNANEEGWSGTLVFKLAQQP